MNPGLPRWTGLLLVAACAAPQRFERTAPHMGTQFRIVVWADDAERAEAGFEAAFARIAELNARLSDYDRSSELSRLSASAVGRPVAVSDDLWSVLQIAQEVSARTGGAFDVTVGPLVALWRRSRRLRELPTAERLATAMRSVGWELVTLHPESRSVELAEPGMKLDLGGIAKGHAAQQALEILRERGLGRALIDAGGDLVLGDPPPRQDGWIVALAPVGDGPPNRAIRVANMAVATSGDRYRFVEIDGVRYAHIVDPRTGLGVTSDAVATAVAADGAVADAMASATYVLGTQQDVERLSGRPIAGSRVELLLRRFDRERAAAVEHASPGFPERESAPEAAIADGIAERLESP